MFNLVLAFLCSASISLIFKFSEGRNLNRYVVTSTNYVIAAGISFLMMNQGGLALTNPIKVLKNIFNGQLLIGAESTTFAILLGAYTGLLFFASFILYQLSVRNYGASLAGMFGKLGILVPMLISLLIWRDYPTGMQTFGIILALFAIGLVNYSPGVKVKLKGLLILLFVIGGLAEFSNKVFQQYALELHKPLFLFMVFFTALLVSLFYSLPRIKEAKLVDYVTGIAVGIPNMLSSFFLIGALKTIPTSVAFPIYSAGSILVIMVFSKLLFQEHLSKKSYAALVMTMVAIAIIS